MLFVGEFVILFVLNLRKFESLKGLSLVITIKLSSFDAW